MKAIGIAKKKRNDSKLRYLPYSQKEFNDAFAYSPNPTDLDKAVCDFIRWRQSFGGKVKHGVVRHHDPEV